MQEGLACVRLLLKCDKIMHTDNVTETVRRFTNIQDSNGETPLHIAAANEATEIVIELLKNQADFNLK